MEAFKKNFDVSLEIEQLFRKHPKFPFLTLANNVEENILIQLFWKYMIQPYFMAFPDNWKEYSSYYQTFRQYDDTDSVILNFYGESSRRFFNLAVNGFQEDKFGYDYFSVNAGIDDFLAEVSGNKEDELYFLGLSVDLRHQKALDAAREFMYAFFVEKLPLEEMEQKITRFEKEEGWKFKRRK